jgi:hypothetical protein
MQKLLFKLSQAYRNPSLWTYPNSLGDFSLLARLSRSIYYQPSLPDNQWELEFERFFKASLAGVQRDLLQVATGPSDKKAWSYFKQVNSSDMKSKACGNQKILSDTYTSFNMLSLIIIFVSSAIIILTSFVLPIAIERRSAKKCPYKILEWAANETLQLQRLAHEGLGARTWKNVLSEYPITKMDQRLAVLDITNKIHPKLKFIVLESEKDIGSDETPVALRTEESDSIFTERG